MATKPMTIIPKPRKTPTFPELDYSEEKVRLRDTDDFSPSVKAMVTLLSSGKHDRPIFINPWPAHIKSDDGVEAEIIRLIKEYLKGDAPQPIFHLIQVWGGISGRNIYVMGDGFNWEQIKGPYQELVDACLSIKDNSDASMLIMADAVRKFHSKRLRLGIAFITKHTRFWLEKVLEDAAFPIYDSIMAINVMHLSGPTQRSLPIYWKAMRNEASRRQTAAIPLERKIFKNFWIDVTT